MDNVTFIALRVLGRIPCPESANGFRETQWIPARDIPVSVLYKMGYDTTEERHPHYVPGLVWDLERQSWRNAKHAVDCHPRRVEVMWTNGKGGKGLSLFSVVG